MESESQIILENLMKKCFPNEAEWIEVKKKLEQDGVFNSDDFDLLNEQEILDFGFKKIPVRRYFLERELRISK